MEIFDYFRFTHIQKRIRRWVPASVVEPVEAPKLKNGKLSNRIEPTMPRQVLANVHK